MHDCVLVLCTGSVISAADSHWPGHVWPCVLFDVQHAQNQGQMSHSVTINGRILSSDLYLFIYHEFYMFPFAKRILFMMSVREF